MLVGFGLLLLLLWVDDLGLIICTSCMHIIVLPPLPVSSSSLLKNEGRHIPYILFVQPI